MPYLCELLKKTKLNVNIELNRSITLSFFFFTTIYLCKLLVITYLECKNWFHLFYNTFYNLLSYDANLMYFIKFNYLECQNWFTWKYKLCSCLSSPIILFKQVLFYVYLFRIRHDASKKKWWWACTINLRYCRWPAQNINKTGNRSGVKVQKEEKHRRVTWYNVEKQWIKW